MQIRSEDFYEDYGFTFWYEKNLQGDIVAVYNQSGKKMISYTYDAWGSCSITYYDSAASSFSAKNPFTYRGYYFDSDLGLYYLQSRYYDYFTGRFINADSALYHSMIGYNMFAYCYNNPVNYVDYNGKSHENILGAWMASMWWLNVADGPLPIGDIVYWSVIGGLSVFAIGGIIYAATSDSKTDTSEDPQQSISEPKGPSPELEAETSDKDSRLKGVPGETKSEGNKETHIGVDGRADRERHHSNHGNPKKHSVPHDHDITWDSSGNPSWSAPHNYWNDEIPIFP